MAEEMIIVHNLLLRLVNSAWLQAFNVGTSSLSSPEITRNFLHYTKGIIDAIHLRHRGEENIIFPAIERVTGVEGFMGNEVEQHRGFERGLEEFEAYLNGALGGKEKYDGDKMRALIDGFMPVLREHLVDEVKTLLTLDRYEERVVWDAWFDGTMGEIKRHSMKGDGKVRTPTVLISWIWESNDC
ncbi:hypothetical protein GE09DRAFT_1099872 [Coniochaeta sp. 2T2.1]|nr:hypothetical protein GE09DRAFT_1099872 [Coniochaeta sp. 2T2.1]